MTAKHRAEPAETIVGSIIDELDEYEFAPEGTRITILDEEPHQWSIFEKENGYWWVPNSYKVCRRTVDFSGVVSVVLTPKGSKSATQSHSRDSVCPDCGALPHYAYNGTCRQCGHEFGSLPGVTPGL